MDEQIAKSDKHDYEKLINESDDLIIAIIIIEIMNKIQNDDS